MTEPVKYRVLDHVRSTLAAVAGGGDYHYSLSKAGQVSTFGASPAVFHTFPAVIIHETSDESEQEFAGYDERVLQIELICAIREPDKLNVPRAIERLVADLTRALHADYTRGGTAVDTNVERASTAFDDSEFPVVLFTVGVRVQYRHGYRDPTSLAPSI